MGLLPPDEVGRRIRQRREARGLKQFELARILGVGASTLCGWEKGEKSVSRENILPLARVLRVPVAWLFADDADVRAAVRESENKISATGVGQSVAG
jgi:transcriptional regulator with XRE-family HTH domain